MPAPPSNTIVLKSLSVLLGLFFIFVGTLKLTPHISKDLYKDLVSERRKINRAGEFRSACWVGAQPIDFSQLLALWTMGNAISAFKRKSSYVNRRESPQIVWKASRKYD